MPTDQLLALLTDCDPLIVICIQAVKYVDSSASVRIMVVTGQMHLMVYKMP